MALKLAATEGVRIT